MLRQILTVMTTLAVMAGAFFAIGIRRRSVDASWCEKMVMGGTVLGDTQPVADDLLERQRPACGTGPRDHGQLDQNLDRPLARSLAREVDQHLPRVNRNLNDRLKTTSTPLTVL